MTSVLLWSFPLFSSIWPVLRKVFIIINHQRIKNRQKENSVGFVQRENELFASWSFNPSSTNSTRILRGPPRTSRQGDDRAPGKLQGINGEGTGTYKSYYHNNCPDIGSF
nr:uncharacterized protein LOC111510408 [Leptinotarsa decemlineata]